MSTPEQQAAWDAEKAAAKPCPTGRVKVEGTVVKVETKENRAHPWWPKRTVMVVKSVEGWCVWCTVPKGATVERDCKIVFEVVELDDVTKTTEQCLPLRYWRVNFDFEGKHLVLPEYNDYDEEKKEVILDIYNIINSCAILK